MKSVRHRHDASGSPSGTLWLASRSPRRAELLHEAGIQATIQPADIDDGELRHGQVPPEWWVMALAYLKARRVADTISESVRWQARDSLVLGADTICAVGRSVLGQPRDADDARRMLRLMRGREHRTITGVCLLRTALKPDACSLTPHWRFIVFDAAIVRIGDLSDAEIDDYIASGDWRGKAGAYNLAERIAAGWPISCMGDPTTVMGLPMQRLPGWIERAMQAN